MTERIDRVVPILNGAAGLMLLVSLFMIFFYAPDELTMGNVQRIFYFHVGSAWVAAITFLISLIAGVSYLIRPSKTKDTIALASVEIGVVFATMTIVSGSIWGRPAWNTWWIWSPRLTSMTVMWLVYVAYFMLRGAIDDDDRRGRFAAVYVIAAFITVLMAYVSIRLLRDIHPVVFGGAAETAQGADKRFAVENLLPDSLSLLPPLDWLSAKLQIGHSLNYLFSRAKSSLYVVFEWLCPHVCINNLNY